MLKQCMAQGNYSIDSRYFVIITKVLLPCIFRFLVRPKALTCMRKYENSIVKACPLILLDTARDPDKWRLWT